jgi:hypothetical protein
MVGSFLPRDPVNRSARMAAAQVRKHLITTTEQL